MTIIDEVYVITNTDFYLIKQGDNFFYQSFKFGRLETTL